MRCYGKRTLEGFSRSAECLRAAGAARPAGTLTRRQRLHLLLRATIVKPEFALHQCLVPDAALAFKAPQVGDVVSILVHCRERGPRLILRDPRVGQLVLETLALREAHSGAVGLAADLRSRNLPLDGRQRPIWVSM